jgi:hypothetical protein
MHGKLIYRNVLAELSLGHVAVNICHINWLQDSLACCTEIGESLWTASSDLLISKRSQVLSYSSI